MEDYNKYFESKTPLTDEEMNRFVRFCGHSAFFVNPQPIGAGN